MATKLRNDASPSPQVTFVLLVGGTKPGSNPAADDSADWTRPARDYASTRYTPLDQITTEPDLTQHPFIHDTGTLGFRTFGAWS